MRLIVAGAAGRMGRVLIDLIAKTPGSTLVGALEGEASAVLGQDAGTLANCGPLGVPVTSDALAAVVAADGIIDFSTPKSTVALAALAAQARIAHVIGTTGLSEEDLAAISAAARHAAIVRSGNMSLGVNLLAGLVEKVARTLGPDFDIEIVEMHHKMKVDAPSGTALLLGEAAARGRQVGLADHAVRVRDGHTGARKEGTIGFATLRGGTVVGDHMAIFAGAGERLELVHRAEDRGIFARGA
ncbi:MAG TPA: 4-hydroxy-tetrahydrodipicolinate reductase, partial [Methylovirgula sp.]|nr:4-hydroxy-tetrahydrodipicolinate reductase [Methylovirgula sp.]